MTMKEFRKKIREQKESALRLGIDLAGWYDEIKYVIETLWKDGFVDQYSRDILKLANGFQISTGNYETFHILQTYDLHSITADKKATKEFAEFLLAY